MDSFDLCRRTVSKILEYCIMHRSLFDKRILCAIAPSMNNYTISPHIILYYIVLHCIVSYRIVLYNRNRLFKMNNSGFEITRFIQTIVLSLQGTLISDLYQRKFYKSSTLIKVPMYKHDRINDFWFLIPITLFCIASHCLVSYCIVLLVLHYAVLCCTVPYCTFSSVGKKNNINCWMIKKNIFNQIQLNRPRVVFCVLSV